MEASRRRSRYVLWFLLSAGSLVLLQYVAVQTRVGQSLDDWVMLSMRETSNAMATFCVRVLPTASSTPVLVAFAVVVTVGLLRRRYRAVIRAVAVVIGANITTQVLKHLVIERPVLSEALIATPNSFPSGHVTLAASVVASALIILPLSASRVVAVPLLLWAGAVSVGAVAAGWHRPSDIFGAVLVLAVWGYGTRVVGALNSSQHIRSTPGGTTHASDARRR